MAVINRQKSVSNDKSESTYLDKNSKDKRRFSTNLSFTTIFLLFVIFVLTLLLLQKKEASPTTVTIQQMKMSDPTAVTIPQMVDDHPSKSKGFNPVYVYSSARTTRKPNEKPTYSQAKQDMLILALTEANDAKLLKTNTIRSVLPGNNNHYFVDLASNDALTLSNTYLLEKNGWNGICLEPNPIYWYHLASYRTCTVVGGFVGGTQEEDGKEIDAVLSNGIYGGIVGEGMDNKEAKKLNKVKRNLVSILTVFQETNTPKVIDYLSLDVEGAETLVMNHFSWDSYKIKFMTIERPKDDLKELLTSNGYKQMYQITNWGETLWIHQDLVVLTMEEVEALVDEKGLRCSGCNSYSKRHHGPDYPE